MISAGGDMDKDYLKNVLAGIGIAGLIAGTGMPGQAIAASG